MTIPAKVLALGGEVIESARLPLVAPSDGWGISALPPLSGDEQKSAPL
jgi:hypothetical protein